MQEQKFYKGFSKPIKIALSCLAIVTASGVGYVLYLFIVLGAFDEDYSTGDLVSEYNKHKKEIYKVKNYLSKIAPPEKSVEIEFKNNTIVLLETHTLDTIENLNFTVDIFERDIPVESFRADSIIKRLGWTRKNLIELKNKLDKANCISVNNKTPVKVGFKRSGFGMYSFDIFEKPIADSLISGYNDSCTHIYINKHLVLEYGGGAVGAQCFNK